MILVLKLVLVPGLVAGVTLAARRWGVWVGGLLTALPVAAGPTLCFYAVEQGREFAADAAAKTTLGLLAVTAFVVVYAWTCRRRPWWVCLGLGWIGFAACTIGLYQVDSRLSLSLALVTASALLTLRFLPAAPSRTATTSTSGWDLPLRMVSAAALVFVLTGVAHLLGPTLRGLLTPFPVATGLMAAFTHAQRGPSAVLGFFRGFLIAEISFAVFCAVFAAAIGSLPLPQTVIIALMAQFGLQGLILLGIARFSRSSARRSLLADSVRASIVADEI
jgi:hypothetical protein